MSISMDLDTKIEANQAFPSSKSTYFKNLFSHNARSNKECRHIKIVTPSSGHILKAIINLVYDIPASVKAKDWEDLKNGADLVFQKKKQWKNCKKGPEGEELLKEKSLMDRKMEQQLNKKRF